MKITTTIIFFYTLIVTLFLYITENIFHPTYLVQMTQKILSFLLIPLALEYIYNSKLGVFGRIQKSSIIYGVGFGLLSAGVITLTYLFLKDSIDWQAIRTSMESRNINETTFLLIFTYIMLGNSLIEEYFFRGIIFRVLLDKGFFLASSVSATMFSLYHITIFQTWFHGYILALALFGLFIGGVFFAWLYRKTGGIWGAWIFHIFADLAILVIGYIEFFA